MGYLSRNKIYTKVEPFKDAKKIYIFCEGEKTEINYFKFFQGFASNIDIVPIPNDNGKSDPVKLKEKAESCIKSGVIDISKDTEDEVWFVIDTDRWNEGGKIEQLKAFVQEKKKFYNGWFVVQSNPAFEIWLYYHFNSEKPKEEDIASSASFKDFVATKIKGGFDNRSMPLEIQQAALNAEKNFEIENEQPKIYTTEVFNLAKQIIRFTKTQLDQCLVETAKKTCC